MKLIHLFFGGCCCISLSASVYAQNLVEQQAPEASGPLNAVRVQQAVKPAFLITPLVHCITARRGQLMTLEFEPNLKPTRLEVSTVGMKLQENGVILPDAAAAPPNVIQLLTPSSIDLRMGEKKTIRSQLRIPSENNPFLTYGVLVKEIPIDDGNSSAA